MRMYFSTILPTDRVVMRVEIDEPVVRGALIMRAAPAPFLLHREDVVELPDQVMARHQPAREDMLRNPVVTIEPVEQLRAGAMGDDLHEEPPLGGEP